MDTIRYWTTNAYVFVCFPPSDICAVADYHKSDYQSIHYKRFALHRSVSSDVHTPFHSLNEQVFHDAEKTRTLITHLRQRDAICTLNDSENGIWIFARSENILDELLNPLGRTDGEGWIVNGVRIDCE